MEETKPTFSNESSGRKFNSVIGSMEKAMNDTAEKATEVGSKIAGRAQHLGAEIADRADETVSSLGRGVTQFAGKIRENSPVKGTIGSAAGAVADGLESSGKYLTDSGLSGIEEDLASVVRRHPMPSVFVGIGLGVLLGRMVMRK